MGSFAILGLFVVFVLTTFGAVCTFGTAVAVERFALGRARTAAAGAGVWMIGSGAPLTVVLIRWAAPSSTWPYGRDDWVEVTATFVGTISIAGGVLGGLAYLLLRRKR